MQMLYKRKQMLLFLINHRFIPDTLYTERKNNNKL